MYCIYTVEIIKPNICVWGKMGESAGLNLSWVDTWKHGLIRGGVVRNQPPFPKCLYALFYIYLWYLCISNIKASLKLNIHVYIIHVYNFITIFFAHFNCVGFNFIFTWNPSQSRNWLLDTVMLGGNLDSLGPFRQFSR